GAHMAADGIALRDLPGKKPAGERLFMTVKGLTPGKHRIVTYHNELGDREPAPLTITVGNTVKVEQLMPSKRATNDYEVASGCVEVEAKAGEDVDITFESSKHQARSSRETPSSELQKEQGSASVKSTAADEQGGEGGRGREGERIEQRGSVVINGFEI